MSSPPTHPLTCWLTLTATQPLMLMCVVTCAGLLLELLHLAVLAVDLLHSVCPDNTLFMRLGYHARPALVAAKIQAI